MKILSWILILGGAMLVFIGMLLGQTGNSGNSWSGTISHIDWTILGCGIAAEFIGFLLRKSPED